LAKADRVRADAVITGPFDDDHTLVTETGMGQDPCAVYEPSMYVRYNILLLGIGFPAMLLNAASAYLSRQLLATTHFSGRLKALHSPRIESLKGLGEDARLVSSKVESSVKAAGVAKSVTTARCYQATAPLVDV
jgi:hypothetical protein